MQGIVSFLVFELRTLFLFSTGLYRFAMLYHVLLIGQDLDDDMFEEFGSSIWTVFTFSLGEFDDGAYNNGMKTAIFTVFALAIIIIMVNLVLFVLFPLLGHFFSKTVKLTDFL